MGVYEEQIVPIKISRLAEYVSQRKHISLEEALTYIYINPMYDNLYDEGAKGLTGLQALALMKRYDVDDFLLDHYDLLHTQGTGYVIDEIDHVIRRRKRR